VKARRQGLLALAWLVVTKEALGGSVDVEGGAGRRPRRFTLDQQLLPGVGRRRLLPGPCGWLKTCLETKQAQEAGAACCSLAHSDKGGAGRRPLRLTLAKK
jgi:hypothetical protein